MPEKPKRCGKYGIYDSPRDLLNKIPGLNFTEMERIREYSYCCGAGGGVKSAFPEFALKIAKTRIEEAENTGAEIITSACPFCSTNLKDGIVEKGSNLKFYDISELLLMAIGSPNKSIKESSMEVS
jgi:Fe-S oxidoreductase